MNKLKDNILALCDAEEEYAQLMSEFLKGQKNLPWLIRTYTDVESLLEEREEINMLVVAESVYTEELKRLKPERLVLLNESGILREGQLHNINKYQQAEQVLRELLEIYVEIAAQPLPGLPKSCRTKFIGIYSPVRRCMQTSFALTMGELLARNHAVLYLNFEHYAGDTELLQLEPARDLADMLYFMTANQDKFALHLQIALRHRGNMDFIPPMKSGQNLLSITGAEWQSFMRKLEELGEYEYVIMDLSESMQGLFDILRQCCRVFTITKNDKIARSKLLQYEQLLTVYAYTDVLEKTCRCSLPRIEKLPETLEQYQRGELAEYVGRILAELLEEKQV
ncbi:MAG: hypothetical protein NC081_08450 [Roseburia sp.]|nr:hypothetical protein [Roseburia sp.]